MAGRSPADGLNTGARLLLAPEQLCQRAEFSGRRDFGSEADPEECRSKNDPGGIRAIPAAEVAARVGSIPHPSWNIATAASEQECPDVHTSCNRSLEARSQATGCTSAKIVWMANQRARLRITPTAAMMALSAARVASQPFLGPVEPTIRGSTGQDVTQVATRPLIVPAMRGLSEPGSRNAAMKPTNWSTDERPRRRLRHTETIEHLAGSSQP